MRIGELAQATGVSTRAIRHYEHSGLLTSTRADNGYRVFDHSAIQRIRNISFLVTAGLTLDDVAHFLPCLDGDVATAPPTPKKLAIARTRLAVLQARIDAQTQVRDRLATALRAAESHTMTPEDTHSR